MEKASRIELLDGQTPSSDHLLGIFVKEPLPGEVKTRLCPPLRPEEAARLYEVAMHEIIERFATSKRRIVLFYAGGEDYFARAFPGLPRIPQSDGDLGRRMAVALAQLLDGGSRAAGLIGSDSPDLPLTLVDKAFNALAHHDAVTVPSDDGGYVFIGLSRPAPSLFEAIPWSTANVCAATRKQAAQHGIRYGEVGHWADVDDLATLRTLVERSPWSATARFIREKLRHVL